MNNEDCVFDFLRGQQGHRCFICDPFRGHDVRMEDEDCTDDVTALYLASLPRHEERELTVTFCWVSGFSPRLDCEKEEE